MDVKAPRPKYHFWMSAHWSILQPGGPSASFGNKTYIDIEYQRQLACCMAALAKDEHLLRLKHTWIEPGSLQTQRTSTVSITFDLVGTDKKATELM